MKRNAFTALMEGAEAEKRHKTSDNDTIEKNVSKPASEKSRVARTPALSGVLKETTVNGEPVAYDEIMLDKRRNECLLEFSLPDALVTNLHSALLELRSSAKPGKVKVFGKVHTTPREFLILGRQYVFSQMEHPREEIDVPDALNEACKYISDFCQSLQIPFAPNAHLINYYDGGQHRIGDHSDEVKKMKHLNNGFQVVATVTTGNSERIMRFKRKSDKKLIHNHLLVHGKCVIMYYDQKRYTHGIPADASVTGLRCSDTIREFL